jgi:hypothetical protein
MERDLAAPRLTDRDKHDPVLCAERDPELPPYPEDLVRSTHPPWLAEASSRARERTGAVTALTELPSPALEAPGE